jgi:hypothetical protein
LGSFHISRAHQEKEENMRIRVTAVLFSLAFLVAAVPTFAQSEVPEGYVSGSYQPTTPERLGTLPLSRSQSYAAAPGNVYSVSYGASTTFLFSASPIFLGGTDGDNSNEFFATPAGGPLYRIDPVAGTVVSVGSFGGIGIRELAYNEKTGVLYGTDYSDLYTIDTTTGVPTIVGPMGTVGNFWAMDYHSGNDKLYAVSNTDATLYEVSMSTGALTMIGATGGSRIADLWYDPGTGNLYAVTDGGGGDIHYTINPATGLATVLGSGYGGNLCGLGEPVAGFTLVASPDPLVGGQAGTFTVTNGIPNTNTFLGYSFAGPGSTFVPQLNVTLGIANPVKAAGPTKTDNTGGLIWTLNVPNIMPRNVWLQAAQTQNASNVVATSVL